MSVSSLVRGAKNSNEHYFVVPWKPTNKSKVHAILWIYELICASCDIFSDLGIYLTNSPRGVSSTWSSSSSMGSAAGKKSYIV